MRIISSTVAMVVVVVGIALLTQTGKAQPTAGTKKGEGRTTILATLTTGGKLEKGKIVGGESHPIKPGDVEFIPASVPHGVSGVTGSITWLNIRFDTNYTTATK
jgi:uncharacterized RmlC-like cupin family protein